MTTSVVKVGGSLFDWQGLPNALARWRSRQPADRSHIWVPGGGPVCDGIRRIDRALGLPADVAHRMCLAAMSAGAELLAHLIPGSRRITAVAEAAAVHGGNGDFRFGAADAGLGVGEASPAERGDRVFDPSALGSRPELEPTWDLTSDSLAAWLASVVGAGELILLKSTPIPAASSLTQWQENGLVDPLFHRYAEKIPRVRMVNLRDVDAV